MSERTQMAPAPIILQGKTGPSITLDPGSMLDLRSVSAGGIDWAPGLAIVDDGDPRIWHALQGFLFTAGPDHIRHPEPMGNGEGRYPLHGSASSHPATAIRVSDDGTACAATIPIPLSKGQAAIVERRWCIDQSGVVHLADRLINSGEQAFPPMMLYHMNIAGALLDGETRLEGEMLEKGSMPWAFGEDPGGVFCVPACGKPQAEVRLGPVIAAKGLTLRVRFDTSSLPHLQIWRNQRPGISVFGIEPCSHRWEKRTALAQAGEMTLLHPGESRSYRLEFLFSTPHRADRVDARDAAL